MILRIILQAVIWLSVYLSQLLYSSIYNIFNFDEYKTYDYFWQEY